MGFIGVPRINFRRDGISKFQYKIISRRFDKKFYLANHSEVAKEARGNVFFDPVKHYMQHGVAAGYDPHPEFSTSFYVQFNPDIVEANQNPFFHYIMYGMAEGRLPRSGAQRHIKDISDISTSPDANVTAPPTDQEAQLYELVKNEFDEGFYKSEYSDIKAHADANPGFDPVAHYIEHGVQENRNPNRLFSTSHYLEVNSDVRRLEINPFYHYIKHGRAEPRTPNLEHNRRFLPLPLSPRVLFVSHSGHMAGAEIMLRDMLEWFANKTAYNIDILVLEYGLLCQTLQSFGRVITLDELPDIEFFSQCDFASQRYDYIYCNSVASAAAFNEIYEKFYLKSNTPLILHIHEMKDTVFKYQDGLRKIDKYVGRYVAASARVREDLVNYQDLSPDRIDVFESFITISATSLSDIANYRSIARKSLDIASDEILIVGSGTVYPRKGPSTFVKTLQLLTKLVSSARVVGVWIGDGPDLHGLRHWIAQNGDEKNIRFIGFKPNARELVAAADIFFLSSKEDPFPLVCLEAAQYAIPIVYFQGCTGIDAFVSTDAGAAIPSYDETAAARTLQYLIANPSERANMGLVARSRVTKNNSQASVMPRLFNFLCDTFQVPPTLSVIIPNYNHERFIGERIQSVLNQHYEDVEIIVLDDASTDSSLDVISYYTSNPKIKLERNLVGSGTPFKQWKKGLSIAKGCLVWIAESDDSCSDNFLQHVLKGYAKNGVNISYGRTVNTDEYGNKNDAIINRYLSSVAGNRFSSSYFCSGYSEVEESMAVACTIVNASGAILRKSSLSEAIDLSDGYKMCGDWIVYLAMLKSGSVFYSAECENYFRRHAASVVSKTEGTDVYFRERVMISQYIVQNFSISDRTINKMTLNLEEEWARFAHIPKQMDRSELFVFQNSVDKVPLSKRRRVTVAIYVHGLMFSKGGIENQGVALANHLHRSGHRVIVMCRRSSSSTPVYTLDSGIEVLPCFDEDNIALSKKLIRSNLVSFGVSVFVVMLSEWLFEPIVSAAGGLRLKIVASEHNDPWVIQSKWWSEKRRESTFKSVDYVHLLLPEYRSSVPYLRDDVIKIIPNGAELRNKYGAKRRDLNYRAIAVGRLVEQKNFSTLIKAFSVASKANVKWELHIFGEGPEFESLSELIKSSKMSDKIYLRGRSNQIHQEMLDSDFIIIPSLFEGYPVVAVEAKMAGLPIVAYEGCNGMNELIREGSTGFMCKVDRFRDLSGAQLALTIETVMRMEERLLEMSSDITDEAERFSFPNVMMQWDEFMSVILN